MFNFVKYTNISVVDKDICAKFGSKTQYDDAEMPIEQKRNRKLIRMTSSVEHRQQVRVVLSDYPRYVNQIWYTTQKTTTVMPERAKFTYHENPW